ncbi:MAG TPA: thioesterase [Flavobacteriaceae bacterium]|nr:DUF4442 domain-containing protein [Ulvibacter sp.]HAH33223.1 thioesterase [Flavobacteriaceae bacterium]|tara:strand:+ start:75 stop:530 length:456 start_codon:yes stop_codon:yes gene_type:complete
MKATPGAINTYIFFKLPSCFFTGVRVKTIDDSCCVTSVKHRWINQNPFKSLFWAVQGMAAELATGALVMVCIAQSGVKVSMLVVTNNARFDKKATGRITFTCEDGQLIKDTIAKAIQTKQGQSCWAKAIGKDSHGSVVSEFNFQWTLKVKS